MIDLEQLFFNGAGRIGRVPFVVGCVVLLALLSLYERVTPAPLQAATGWLADLLLIFCASAVVSKRLHDVGLAGWWTALGFLAFFNVWPRPQGLGWMFLGLLLAGAAWLGLSPGMRGFNRFGHPWGQPPAQTAATAKSAAPV